MKRIHILAGALMAAWLSAEARHVTLTIAGTLEEELAKPDDRPHINSELFISGPMNQADFASLREFCHKEECQSVNLSKALIEGDAIPPDAFYDQAKAATADGRLKLAYVRLPDNIREIGDRAFYNTSLHFINFPASLEKIGDEAFANTLLRSVTLPESCVRLGEGAFSHTAIGDLPLPEGVTEIPARYAESSSIMALSLPQGVERIGENAFNGCLGLQGINLPEGITTIDRKAFFTDYESNIEEIDLPSTLTCIGSEAFIICNPAELKAIKSRAQVPPVCEVSKSGLSEISPFVNDENNMLTIPLDTPVYVPQGSAPAYRKAPGWERFLNFIETGDFEQAVVSEIKADHGMKISTDGTAIIVEAPTPGSVSIATIDGRSEIRDVAEGKTRLTGFLPGLYIVNTDKMLLK